MEIIVSPRNEQEEKVLRAFLDSLQYEYADDPEVDIPAPPDAKRQSLEEYNQELEQAVSEVESGHFITHEQAVKEMKSWRRK